MNLSRKSIERLLDLAAIGIAHLNSLSRRSGHEYVDAGEDQRTVARAKKALLPQEKKAKGGRSSRNKGLAAEREARDYLREQGFPEATRGLGQSRGGGKEAADCINVGDLHVEVKRVEKLNIHAALAQAGADASPEKIPVVLHRRNGEAWKVTLLAADFFSIYRDAVGIEPKED